MITVDPSNKSNGTLNAWLNSTCAPFVVVTDSVDISEEWQTEPNKKWLIIDGKDMPDWPSTFRILTEVFQLPDYFGNNLNALDECLSDSDVLQGGAFVVQILNASVTLNADGPDGLPALMNCFLRIAEELAKPISLSEPGDRPAIPFHVLLCDVGTVPRLAGYLPVPESPPPETPR